VDADLDLNLYQNGLKISDKEFAQLQILHSEFLGNWNYTISPQIRND
jgi:hypothetical protein